MEYDIIPRLRADNRLRQRLAKYMALRCFRNTFLEDLHAGKVPNSANGDYSDVRVVTPFGDIEWPRLSRFSDREMKRLMIDVVNQCYDFITQVIGPESCALLDALSREDIQPEWYDPPHHGDN